MPNETDKWDCHERTNFLYTTPNLLTLQMSPPQTAECRICVCLFLELYGLTKSSLRSARHKGPSPWFASDARGLTRGLRSRLVAGHYAPNAKKTLERRAQPILVKGLKLYRLT